MSKNDIPEESQKVATELALWVADKLAATGDPETDRNRGIGLMMAVNNTLGLMMGLLVRPEAQEQIEQSMRETRDVKRRDGMKASQGHQAMIQLAALMRGSEDNGVRH